MRNVPGCLLIAVTSLACDPSYRLDLVVRTTASGKPIAGAFVSQLTPNGATGCRTNTKGVARCSFGGFLQDPSYDPVLVLSPGKRLFVAVPGRDFALEPRGFFWVTEWDAQLEVDLEPVPSTPGIVPRCSAPPGMCHVVLPQGPFDHCQALAVDVRSAGPTVAGLRGKVDPVGHGAVRLSFDAEGRLGSQVVWWCHGEPHGNGNQARFVVVTDPADVHLELPER